MPATQPIPQRRPDPATAEAAAVLALHNAATLGRRVDHPVPQHSFVPGETAGSKVAGSMSISGGRV
jgi:hypothetical protein